jgi:hypothetical protein
MVEIEIGGHLKTIDTKHVRVVIPLIRHHRNIFITEEGIEIEVMDKDGEVAACGNVNYDEVVPFSEDVLEDDL